KRAALPAPPKLGAIPELVQTPCLRATWQPVKGAVGYRAAVARDAALSHLSPYQPRKPPAPTLCRDDDPAYTLVVPSVDAPG
ncbi:hypothetical protein K4H00_25665, partial [Mycobacterium tuberculosis]|nr:hypothetical protein [Mycobacterium tuberculosis]